MRIIPLRLREGKVKRKEHGCCFLHREERGERDIDIEKEKDTYTPISTASTSLHHLGERDLPCLFLLF